MAKLFPPLPPKILALLCLIIALRSLLLGWQKDSKSYIFILVCLKGLTTLVSFKMTEMANQIEVGRVYFSHKQAQMSAWSNGLNNERQPRKCKAFNIWQLFYYKWPTVIPSDANYDLTFFLKNVHFGIIYVIFVIPNLMWLDKNVFLFQHIRHKECGVNVCMF